MLKEEPTIEQIKRATDIHSIFEALADALSKFEDKKIPLGHVIQAYMIFITAFLVKNAHIDACSEVFKIHSDKEYIKQIISSFKIAIKENEKDNVH